MRQQSVHSLHTNIRKKEKVMRKSFTAAVALVVVLTAAVPAAAAPRDRSNRPTLGMIIKQVMKKVFGISTQAVPTVPIPGPDSDNN
jgi:hypothetical protein